MPSQIYLFFIGYELLTAEARSKYPPYVPRVEDIKNDEWVDAYLYLKQRTDSSM